MLPNTTHLNNLRKETEGEGAPKHDLLKQLEKAKKRGTVLPNRTHLNNLRKKTEGEGAPKHDLVK